jgi:peptidoglycan hydrolase-like amidase
LYDLSTKFTSRNVSCDGECKVTAEGKDYFVEYAKIENRSGSLYLILSDQTISTTKIQITSNLSGLVTVTNYARESYAKIPRNTFRGSLIFEKQVMKSLATSQFIEQYVVINNLPFTDYLKGIAETTDSESAEKIKVMALLAKTYALFYMNGKNPHPSIPK